MLRGPSIQIVAALQQALRALDELKDPEAVDTIYRVLVSHVRSAHPVALLEAESMEASER